MKSLISADHSDDRVSAWVPLDFDGESAQPSETFEKSVEEIFRPDENTVLWTSYAHSRLIKSGQPLLFDHWNPRDLGSVAVNETVDWDLLPLSARNSFVSPEKLDIEPREIIKEARYKADEIILKARQTADQVIAEAQGRVIAIQEEGHEKGLELARQEAGPMLASLNAMVEQVDHWQQALFSEAETFVASMIGEIARTMFGDGVALDSKALQLSLEQVLEKSHALGDLKIFLNPLDAAMLDPSWRENQSVITGNRVQVVSVEGITRGGCFVQGAMGTMDARVETQLEAILDSLKSNEEN